MEGYASEESSNEIVGVLQNDFCPNPDLDLGGEDDIEDCQNFMPLFIPDAMKQISQMVTFCSAVESDDGRGNIPHQLWLKYKWGDEPRGKYFW